MTQSSEQESPETPFVSLVKSSDCNLCQWLSSTLTRLITTWLPRSAVFLGPPHIDRGHAACSYYMKFYNESNIWTLKNLVKNWVYVWKLYIRNLAAQFGVVFHQWRQEWEERWGSSYASIKWLNNSFFGWGRGLNVSLSFLGGWRLGKLLCNFCSVCVFIIYKLGHRPHNTTWQSVSWTPLL